MTNEREQGFTLIEVTITAVILLFVMAGLLGLLESQTKSDKTVQDIVATQQDVRLAVTAVARDIRAGTLTTCPDAAACAGPTATEIDLNVYDSPSSTNPTLTRWRVDASGSRVKLVRESYSNGAWTRTYSLAGIPNAGAFVYLSPRPVPMDPVLGAPMLISCTATVRLDLAAATGATSTSQFDEQSDVAVRNSTAQASLCP